MKIGNSVAEVRAYLAGLGRDAPMETRATTIAEREQLTGYCPRCGALNSLCLSETGLPASGPHAERIHWR